MHKDWVSLNKELWWLQKIRQVTGRFQRKYYGKLADSNGKIIISTDEKKYAWMKYLKYLFYDVKAEQ